MEDVEITNENNLIARLESNGKCIEYSCHQVGEENDLSRDILLIVSKFSVTDVRKTFNSMLLTKMVLVLLIHLTSPNYPWNDFHLLDSQCLYKSNKEKKR